LRVILRRRRRAGGPPTRARARAQAGGSYRNWSVCSVGAPGTRHGLEPGRAGGWCGCANTAQSGGAGEGAAHAAVNRSHQKDSYGPAHLCLAPKRTVRHAPAMGGPTPRQALSSSVRVAGRFTSCAGARGARSARPPAYAAAIWRKKRSAAPPALRCTLGCVGLGSKLGLFSPVDGRGRGGRFVHSLGSTGRRMSPQALKRLLPSAPSEHSLMCTVM